MGESITENHHPFAPGEELNTYVTGRVSRGVKHVHAR